MSEEEKQENPSFETRFKPKNGFWKLRSKSGRNPKFDSSEKLWEACVEYFESAEENPFTEHKCLSNGSGVLIYKMRPFTLGDLCVFLDIDVKTWRSYSQKPDFLPMVTLPLKSCIANWNFLQLNWLRRI